MRRGKNGGAGPRPDPMPARIEPCLALLKEEPPKGDAWIYEIKWDGYRLAVHVEPNNVRILTRGGHDWTPRFPSIAEAAKALGRTMILDGEAVVLDKEGRPDFGLLQQALGGRGGKRRSSEAILYVFDLLYLDGRDVTKLPFFDRRQLLDPLFELSEGAIRLSDYIQTDGAELLGAACARGLEGIIAKNKTAPYRSGRRGDWLKIKCVSSDSFAIVGYEPSEVGHGGIGRLLLAAKRGEELVYVGGVGTGFNGRTASALRQQLDALQTDNPALKLKHKGAIFVDPRLIAEVEYRAWTGDEKLRHPSYKGLRAEQDAAVIYELSQRD
ncbi:non-homologous end-joining DNA ligase [Rhizobium sp. RAF56]|uniref:non-homologous end-joining DNA ligase n=1 Tax=Rhizobium sp. RAF56 TaxID=3233062 RepID=UPI003F95D51B